MGDWQHSGMDGWMDGFSVHLLFSAQVSAPLTVTTHGTRVVVHGAWTAVEYKKGSSQTPPFCREIPALQNALIQKKMG